MIIKGHKETIKVLGEKDAEKEENDG